MYKQKLHSDFLECRIVKLPFLLLFFPRFINPVSLSYKSSRSSLPPQTCTKPYSFKVNTCKRWYIYPLQEVIRHGLKWASTKRTLPGMCWHHTAGEWCSVTTLPENVLWQTPHCQKMTLWHWTHQALPSPCPVFLERPPTSSVSLLEGKEQQTRLTMCLKFRGKLCLQQYIMSGALAHNVYWVSY